ncbi:alpha/beta fold hydrolase [Streptomyces sp. NRRL WC-3742]|uniref:alpha/beta fold hydrolase n=1 Tax=Streptomyces sp. NRRL WC-3742 TaxID=1463934 RepID=UPI0004C4E69C|nr:alpha/beta hydrolase [Streptomyces sp. NRRL WC-3742]
MTAVPLPHTLIGHGPHHVIAVHGWFADRGAYERMLPDLDLDAFTYAFVDLRGYGEARDLPGRHTTTEGGADLLATADALGWDRFSLIGHSMGGCIVQRVLTLAPERVRRLVGIAPVPASGVPMPPEQWELFAGAADLPENRAAIIDITTSGVRPRAWVARMLAQSLGRSDVKAFRAWLDSWALEDFHEEIAGLPLPVRVFVCELDQALTGEFLRGTWLRHYPNATAVDLPATGHYPMEESPLQLISAIEEFLGEDDGEG